MISPEILTDLIDLSIVKQLNIIYAIIYAVNFPLWLI